MTNLLLGFVKGTVEEYLDYSTFSIGELLDIYFVAKHELKIRRKMFLRFSNKLLHEKTGIAKSTIWLWISEGKFLKPIKLSHRITIWEEDKLNYQ